MSHTVIEMQAMDAIRHLPRMLAEMNKQLERIADALEKQQAQAESLEEFMNEAITEDALNEETDVFTRKE
jgi:prefoldin subunit 5